MLLNFPKIQLIQSHKAYRMIILKKNQIKKIKIKKNYLYFKPQQEIKMKYLNKIMKKIKKNMNPYQKIKNKILRIA